MIFQVIRKTFGVRNAPTPLIGSQVDLASVATWIIREERLHKLDKEIVDLNLKLDGRPFWGNVYYDFVHLFY